MQYDHEVYGVTQEQAWNIFEEQTKELLGITAQEFCDCFDLGRWPDPDDFPYIMYLQSVREFAS